MEADLAEIEQRVARRFAGQDDEPHVHRVSGEELEAAGIAPLELREKVKQPRPEGGHPKVGSYVKIVRSGQPAVNGAYGTVVGVRLVETRLRGWDAILTVRVSLGVGPHGRRRMVSADIHCFASSVVVHQQYGEVAAYAGEKENVTEEQAERLMVARIGE